MTIKKQFHLLIAAVIVVPVLCALFIPFYHYLSSPERVLLHSFSQVRKADNLQLTEAEWNELSSQLRHMPPDMEAALIRGVGMPPELTVIISTIPGITPGSYNDKELWKIFDISSNKYFYQFSTPNFHKNGEAYIIVSRALRNDMKRKHNGDLIASMMIFLILFAVIMILAIIKIAHTIFSSITVLEQKTQRIADGDLSVSLDDQKKTKSESNEIISLTESLEKMRRSLLDSQQRRTRFIMGISHDLRTPVAVIKGYTEAISDDIVTDPSEIKNSLEIITTKTNQLEGMIDTLINFVKLDNADWRQKLVPESVYEVVQEFAKGAEMTGNVFKRNVTASVNIDASVKVPMDKQLFSRALENLFSNAIRYSKDGDSISIFGSETSDFCIVKVSDTGIGIADKDKEHIFELFYRGTNSRREEGMGIGLTVVKSIVDTHGWTISVESESGKGTTFTISIPKQATGIQETR